MENRRLYRSLVDRKIGGVAGGLAEYFDVDPLLVRLTFVVLIFAGPGVPLYFILWIATPEQPLFLMQNQPTDHSTSRTEPGTESGSAEPSPVAEGSEGEMSGSPKPSEPFPPLVKERRRGGLVAGLILITLGLLFLANQLFPDFNFGDVWPVVLIVAGIGLLFTAFPTNKNKNL